MFSGIPEVKEENSDNTHKKISELFVYMCLEGENLDILRYHRIGIIRHNPVRPRDIVAVFDLDDKHFAHLIALIPLICI